MSHYRRVGHGQNPYMSTEDVRADLAPHAEHIPAAVEFLAQALGALEGAGVRTEVTCTLVPGRASVAAGGRIGGGRGRELTVTQVNQAYDHYPRTPDENATASVDRPVSLDEVAAHTDPRDDDLVLLLDLLRALADAEPHLIVEALASPARWRPEAIVRTPDGDRLAIATNR